MAEKKVQMLEPRATEKTYAEQTKRTYVFVVKKGDSKQAIAKRVEDAFNVKVTDVRTLVRKGKKMRFSRGKRAFPGITYKQDKKLAYVTLAEGNSIRVFEQESAQEENNKTSAKESVEKAEDKNAGKEKK